MTKERPKEHVNLPPFDRKAWIEERMKWFHACAQCQCAAHTMGARRDAEESADSFEKMEAFYKTPEGQKLMDSVMKTYRKLLKKVEKKGRTPGRGGGRKP